MTIAVTRPEETVQPSLEQTSQSKKIGVLKETYSNECRVATTPDTAKNSKS